MTTTDPTAGPQIVSGDYDEAAAHHDAMLREIESLRSQLAEAREQRDHAQRWNDEARRAWAVDSAELAVVRGELAAAREAYQRLVTELDQLRAEWSALRGQVGRAIVLCGPRGDKPIDVIVASVIDDLEEARQENADLRAQLAEAREQRDQAAEALVRAETERDEARNAQVQHATAMEIIDDLRAVLALSPGQSLTEAVTQIRDDLAWLRRQVLAVAEDLERYASDLRWEGLERRLAWTLRQIVAGERPEACRCGKPAEPGHCSHCHDDPPAQTVADALDDAVGHLRDMLLRALATTAPETAPQSPHTADPAPARVEASTEHLGDADGAVAYWRAEISEILAAWLTEEQHIGWQRLASDVAEQIISDLGIADMAAERDRLRAEAAMLRAEREWLADRARRMGIAEAIIAAHGPAHAVSAAAGRLRTERDALRAEVERAREIAHSYRHEIGAAQVFDVLEAALGSTPDTGSTT